MLFELDKSLDDLKLSEYGLSISALDEVYIKVCADNAQEEVDFNMDLMNCNRFRLHTGIRKYFVQWKAMFYKKFLITFQPPTLFITQCLIVIFFAMFACIHIDLSRKYHPPLNISLDLYNDPKVIFTMSNESSVKLKMQPLAFYLKDYFKKFQTTSTLISSGNESSSGIYAHSTADSKSIRSLDVKTMGCFEFQNTKNVVIAFNNLPLHSIPIMVLLWINIVTKFELGEDYNVEVVNKPLSPHKDYISAIEVNSTKYAMFVSLGLSVALAFFSYSLTKGRVERQILLQLLGGLRVSTLWLANLFWDLMLIAITVSLIVCVSLLSETVMLGSNLGFFLVELYIILMYLGLGVLLFAYIISFCFKDPLLSVAFSALKDIIFCLIVFKIMSSVHIDEYPLTNQGIFNFFNTLFKTIPTYGAISVLFKLHKLRMTNTSCREACAVLKSRFPKIYVKCTAETLCTMDPKYGRKLCCCKCDFFA